MDLRDFATDRDAEVEGVWVEVGDGAELKVAREGNPRYSELVRKRAKPYQIQMERGAFPEDKSREMMAGIVAETILLDWRGLYLDDERVAYSKEAAKELLLEYPDFWRMVQDLARDVNNFREQRIEETAEALGEGSSGN